MEIVWRTSASRRADNGFIQYFLAHSVCCFILTYRVLLENHFEGCGTKLINWSFWIKLEFLSSSFKRGRFLLLHEQKSKRNEVMYSSGNNPVPILSEDQSIVRERTHPTYSVHKFLVDHPASLLPRLGGVYSLKWVGLKKALWKDRRFSNYNTLHQAFFYTNRDT